eukprot:CAMPEP_0198296596 /NCGR_PEP_ID=MMETSP1449-20131203/33246_1 /TAXON_ID=420275 /ORGANISM="Attheya septentrionalis, Strain CCMP2084" /LENGTH=643 /DNA_ID=CAMNT_0043997261 /DNA_START=49 /DNA_END=1980 /DNA_ORIENTATION=+
MSLTHGAVRTLATADQADPSYQPVLQVIHVKAVGGGGASERFRAIFSDGQNFVQGMLATQLNPLVHSGEIQENSVIAVKEFMKNVVQGRTVIIVLKLEVITANPGQRFGDPKDIEKENIQQSSGGAAPAAQPMYGNRPTPVESKTSGGMYNQSTQPTNTYGAGSKGGSSGANPYGATGRFGGSGSAPIVRSSNPASGDNYTPISQLNIYQNRWTIKGRVTSKSAIRTWSNAKGDGSLFSIDILDASATDVRATFFKEAVDKFFNTLEVDKVYTFTGGRLKTANIQYNTCKSGFEITFDQNAEIHLDNDTGEIQQQTFEFVQIAQLEQVEPGKYVDILAVVKSVGEVGSIVSKKSGQELKKCELVLVDDSAVEVTLTVWGEEATKAQALYGNSPIVGFKRSRVSDFGGRSLSANSAVVNPRLPETERVRAWWQSVGSNSANPTRSLSSAGGKGGRLPAFDERKTVSSIKNEHMGQNTDKPDWVSFKGTFNFIKKDKDGGAWYPACANAGEPCKNRFKVTQTADGNWYCDKCQGTYPNCVRRFIFSATITDDTSTTWVSIFNEQAEVLLGGVTADDVYKNTHENHDQDAYDAFFSKATFTDWVFNCKVRQEFMNDEARVKTQIQSLHPMDYVQESRNLLQAIAQF